MCLIIWSDFNKSVLKYNKKGKKPKNENKDWDVNELWEDEVKKKYILRIKEG